MPASQLSGTMISGQIPVSFVSICVRGGFLWVSSLLRPLMPGYGEDLGLSDQPCLCLFFKFPLRCGLPMCCVRCPVQCWLPITSDIRAVWFHGVIKPGKYSLRFKI
jgi:hypothetical protein